MGKVLADLVNGGRRRVVGDPARRRRPRLQALLDVAKERGVRRLGGPLVLVVLAIRVRVLIGERIRGERANGGSGEGLGRDFESERERGHGGTIRV